MVSHVLLHFEIRSSPEMIIPILNVSRLRFVEAYASNSKNFTCIRNAGSTGESS